MKQMLQAAPAYKILEAMLPSDAFRQLRRDRKEWQQAQQEFDSEKRTELIRTLDQIDFDKAMFDEAKTQVTFPAGRQSLTMAKVANRWVILN